MKRAAIILIAALWLALSADAFAGATNVAIVYKVSGTVEFFKAGSKTAVQLAPATHLSDGDRIKTGKDGYVFLIFVEDKSQVKVREGTDLSIAANRTAKGLEQQVNVDIGKLWTHVTKAGSAMRVSTPTSVASVKGTVWWTLVELDGTTQILGLQGIVLLFNKVTNESKNVDPGYTGTSNQTGIVITQTTGGVPNSEGRGQRNTIRIPFRDQDGNDRSFIIEYEEVE